MRVEEGERGGGEEKREREGAASNGGTNFITRLLPQRAFEREGEGWRKLNKDELFYVNLGNRVTREFWSLAPPFTSLGETGAAVLPIS